MDRTDAKNTSNEAFEAALDDQSKPVDGSTSRRRGSGFAVRIHPLELLVVVGFLALVFVLGLFPLKDTDFWWHLRTGDLIRATGKVPTTDLYTYTVPEARWVDLHWGFQVLISFGYELGGVPFLNIAKSVITTAAMMVLVLGCRRPGWPIWVSVVSWCPALLVLSGRMYVRPETISLWWMSLVILVIFHWRKHPRIMWMLPPVFLCWVNTQGIFVLGFVIIAMGLAEVAADPASWRRDQREWWSRAVACIGLSVIATLFNPYGFRGLFFPLELAGTMGNPVFRSIGELTPIPQFIQSLGFKQFPLSLSLKSIPVGLNVIFTGFRSFPLPLKLHLFTMFLAFMSFVVPVVVGGVLLILGFGRHRAMVAAEPVVTEESKSGRSRRKQKQVAKASPDRPVVSSFVRFSLFRFLMFLFFSILSFQATRNSHQFAAVMGTITAANFAQWASLYSADRKSSKGKGAALSRRISPGNSVALAMVTLLLVWVGTGHYYADAGEGRTIGWEEEPLWFPHEAVKSAAGEGLPPKFASFHNGHASLYDYYWGPERKVFSDARLEVIGPNLYQDQVRLGAALNQTDPSWRGLVAKAGRPVMLADHLSNSGVSVTLMAANDYACIHFDPIAAVFTPSESLDSSNRKRFDFLNAHYDPEMFHARTRPERLALARAMRNLSGGLAANSRDDLARPMVLSGIGLSSELTAEDPTLADAWKLLGQMLNLNQSSVQRDQTPVSFNPLDDLDTVRGIYALKRAVQLNPEDFSGLYTLALIQRGLVQFDQELETLAKLVTLTATNTTQAAEIENARGRIATLKQLMGLTVAPEGKGKSASDQPTLPSAVMEQLAKPLTSAGASRAEIERNVNSLLKNGLVRRAAETLNQALPQDDAPTELLERLGSLWLWLGRPEEARQAFGRIKIEPKRQSLLAACWIVTNNMQEASKFLDEAAVMNARPESVDEIGFTVLAIKARLAMEKGDLKTARSVVEGLARVVKTGSQADVLERLRRNLPKTE